MVRAQQPFLPLSTHASTHTLTHSPLATRHLLLATAQATLVCSPPVRPAACVCSCECKNPAGTNPFHRPIPPETSKTGTSTSTAVAEPSSPSDTHLVVKLGEGAVAASPQLSPLKALGGVPAGGAKSLQPPSPTAFVDGALLAAASAAATEEDTGQAGSGRVDSGAALDAAPMSVELPLPEGMTSSSMVIAGDGERRRLASAAGSEGDDAELLHAAASSKSRAPSCAPPNIALPGPSPDLSIAADTPEPWGDSRGSLGPTPPAEEPKLLAALPVLRPSAHQPRGVVGGATSADAAKDDADGATASLSAAPAALCV